MILPCFFRSVSLFNPIFLFSVTSPHTLSSRRFSKSCRRSFRTTRTSLAVTRGQNRLVSFMPFYAILRPLSQNLRWLPGCFQFNACVSNAQAFSSDHEAPLVGKTLSHPWNTSEKDLVTIHLVSTTLFHYLCYSSYVTLQPSSTISIYFNHSLLVDCTQLTWRIWRAWHTAKTYSRGAQQLNGSQRHPLKIS